MSGEQVRETITQGEERLCGEGFRGDREDNQNWTGSVAANNNEGGELKKGLYSGRCRW